MPNNRQNPNTPSGARRPNPRTRSGANQVSLGQPRPGLLREISPPPFHTIPPLMPRTVVPILDSTIEAKVKQESPNDKEESQMKPTPLQQTRSMLVANRSSPTAPQRSSWEAVRGLYPSLTSQSLTKIKENLSSRGLSATRAQMKRIRAGLSVLTPSEAETWAAQRKRERQQAKEAIRSQHCNAGDTTTATQIPPEVQENESPRADTRRNIQASNDMDVDHNPSVQPTNTSTNTDQILRQVIQKYKDEVTFLKNGMAFLKGVLQDQGVNEGMLDEIEARINAGEQRAAAVKRVISTGQLVNAFRH